MIDTSRSTELPDEAVQAVVESEPRYNLVLTVLAHPRESVSIPEFEFENPSLSESTIRYHLDQLQDVGVVEKIVLDDEDRVAGFPYTFYELTGAGEHVVEIVGVREQDILFSEISSSVPKPDRILDIQELPR